MTNTCNEGDQGTAVAEHWYPRTPRQAIQNNENVMWLGALLWQV